MTPNEVYTAVQEIRLADYHKVGQVYFDERIQRIEAAGWRIGCTAYSVKVYHARRGRKQLLKRPRYEARVSAYWYHAETRQRVFYYDNEVGSMFYAKDQASRAPAPQDAVQYTSFQPGN